MQHLIKFGTRIQCPTLTLISVDLYSACPHRQFYTLRGLLHNQTSTLKHACRAGRQFVPFLCWSLVCPDWALNLAHPAAAPFHSYLYCWSHELSFCGAFHKSLYERFLLYQFIEPVLNYRWSEFVALTNSL